MATVSRLVAVALGLAIVPGAADAQQPRTQRVAISPGDTVVVTTMGPATGPAVVVVPGLLGGVFSFRNVTPPLVRAGMRVVIVEPLGTGASARPRHADYTLEGQARRIGHAMNAAGVRDAILLCHAVGGSMCYRFALQSPERVQGIVAVNGGPDEEAASRDLRRAMRFAPIIRLVGGPGRARAQLADGLRANSYDPAWVTDAILDSYGEPYSDFGATIDALSGMAAAREPQPLAPRLDRIQAPVRLLVGTGGDGGITRGEQLDVLRRIRDFQVTAVPRAGQYIHEERPGAVADAVLALRRELADG
ncbi:MAG TPA: alpha/beta fold hydrolase [Longimicrobiales bacterium]|nr:alpha/beta fold hydrolase [Longimicrobiales bacterium]